MSIVSLLKGNFERYKKIGDGKVLVYTMGKVGSSAIYEGLPEAYQLHNFDGEIPAKYFSSRFTPYIRRYLVEALRWKIFHQKASKEYFRIRDRGEKIKIISMVRDPVARNVSAFFQNLDQSQVYGNANLVSDFFALTNHMLPLEWFDIELKRHFGVDVYEQEFDKSAGYTIVERECCDLLVLQLEKLNDLESVIGHFVQIDDFKLLRSGMKNNYSSEKWYKEHVVKLKEEISFSPSYLELMYDSRYARHFYSEADIQMMRKRWRVSNEV